MNTSSQNLSHIHNYLAKFNEAKAVILRCTGKNISFKFSKFSWINMQGSSFFCQDASHRPAFFRKYELIYLVRFLSIKVVQVFFDVIDNNSRYFIIIVTITNCDYYNGCNCYHCGCYYYYCQNLRTSFHRLFRVIF